ncbi:MAG: YciI family protein [Bacteroidetes bacterium]|nr:YciI family protein [Bacteroidota bacterium]
MLKGFASFFVLCFAGLLSAQTPADSILKKVTPQPETMRTYYMVFLKKGPNWTPEKTEETAKIQAGHMAHIQKMADSKKLLLAGPFMDNQEIRGIFVFKVDTMEEAKALTDEDPAVKAGRLIMEIHPWYSAKGINIDPLKE